MGSMLVRERPFMGEIGVIWSIKKTTEGEITFHLDQMSSAGM